MSIQSIMRSAGWVWLVLVVLSISNFVIGEDLGIEGHWEIGALMLIAFIKARLIIRHFMEVKDAPLPLRIAFDVWCVIAPVTLMIVVVLGEKGMLA